jgi:hypothetical protein
MALSPGEGFQHLILHAIPDRRCAPSGMTLLSVITGLVPVIPIA